MLATTQIPKKLDITRKSRVDASLDRLTKGKRPSINNIRAVMIETTSAIVLMLILALEVGDVSQYIHPVYRTTIAPLDIAELKPMS